MICKAMVTESAGSPGKLVVISVTMLLLASPSGCTRFGRLVRSRSKLAHHDDDVITGSGPLLFSPTHALLPRPRSASSYVSSTDVSEFQISDVTRPPKPTDPDVRIGDTEGHLPYSSKSRKEDDLRGFIPYTYNDDDNLVEESSKTNPSISSFSSSSASPLIDHTAPPIFLKSNARLDPKQTSTDLIKQLCNVRGKKQICYRHGSSICYCTGGLADCSGKQYVPNISYAPRLPASSKCLLFSFNNVRHFDDSYFANVSSFAVIDFSSNHLISVSQKTFERFSNLQYLILNDNDVSYKYLRNVLRSAPKVRLDLKGLALGEVPRNYFYPYRNISTSVIYFDYNFMPNLNLSEFALLGHLQYLSLTNCNINAVTLSPMPNLRVLDLRYNNLSDFLTTCNNASSVELSTVNHTQDYYGQSSYFPALSELYLGRNPLMALPPPNDLCLPRLLLLHLYFSSITVIPARAFATLTSLKVLLMNRMTRSITAIGPAAFCTASLTTLQLSRNNIDFSSAAISSRALEGCSNVEVLYIDHNKFGRQSDQDIIDSFRHTPRLKYLYLGSTGLRTVPNLALSQLPLLTKLFLYINEITEIQRGTFDNFSALEYLYLDQNHIAFVGEFSPVLMKQLKVIDLSKNSFLCNCDLLWFQSWLLESGAAQFADYDNYKCVNTAHNTSVQNFILSKQACLMSKSTYILFVATLSVMIFLFFAFAILFRFRWNIRLMLYETRNTRRNPETPIGEMDFRYDLFIIYCKDDSDWVIDLLLPKVETEWKIGACVHERDFAAGGFIMDNIVACMNSSRRIMVVVSSAFARSRWCNMELKMCQSHVITHDLPSLLVIKLGDIESREMSSSMMALYSTTCFLQWPEEAAHIGRFWKRLHDSLKTLIDKTQLKQTH